MKNWINEAVICAAGLFLLGLMIQQGIERGVQRTVDKERVVSVKGLSEKEVMADQVTWPLVYKELGNDIPTLYNSINKKNQTIVMFLKENGITESEISINPAEVTDLQAQSWRSDMAPYRYNCTSSIIVNSSDIEKVRSLILKQTELLKLGIVLDSDDYRTAPTYSYGGLNDIKPDMIEEATKNARAAAVKFAKDSDSRLGKIKRASQGQFSISSRDELTPYIKVVRVVTSVDYYLKN